MTWEWLGLGGLTLAALGLMVALARLRTRTSRDLAAARSESAELRERLERLERDRSRPVADEREFRITGVGVTESDPAVSEQVPLDRAVFADLVLRESVIRVGSLAHGVRRALAPEARNRIRFEMRREVRRARKQRRADRRAAHREWQARQRDALTDDDLRDTA